MKRSGSPSRPNLTSDLCSRNERRLRSRLIEFGSLETPIKSQGGSRSLLLQRRLDAAGANCAPTDPCLKGAEQSDQNKDRCEQPCLRNEATTGEEEHDRSPATGSAAFAVDVLLHPGHDAGFNSNIN